MSEDVIAQALSLVDAMAKANKRYRDLNNQIKKVQGSDFPTYIPYCDERIENETVKLLDVILGDEIASYFLYECPSMPEGGRMIVKGKEWRIKTISDVAKYVADHAKKPS